MTNFLFEKKVDPKVFWGTTTAALLPVLTTLFVFFGLSWVTADLLTSSAAKSRPEVLGAKTSSPKKIGRINFANNKFGVHMFGNAEELALASDLVNSQGGDWGWVTVAMDIHENSIEKWNDLFRQMKEKHLSPIIQISNNSKIPNDSEIDDLANFLNSLTWPIKLRMVSPFSEVNADEYWGGKLDPEGYARVLDRFIDQLKGKNGDFFVMNGAFNASAQTAAPTKINCIHTDLGVDTCYLSEIGFLERMNKAVPGIFKKLDGWAAHTYPHPGYRGRPTQTRVGQESAFEAGRNTVRSYQFELRLLQTKYGLNNIPVFILETGWPHKQGRQEHPEWYDEKIAAQYYRDAFQKIFLPDRRVVAVTPFILKNDAYDNFAFVAADGHKYPQWEALATLAKVKGQPPVN